MSFVKDLGAQEVVDYAAGPFESATGPVDMILDTIGGEVQRRSRSLLKPGGVLVSIAGELIDDGKVKTFIASIVPLERAREAFDELVRSNKRGKVVISGCRAT